VHELSVTQSVLELALKHAERAGAKRLTKINLTVGEIAGIIDQSVQFYFDMLSKDTLAEGAELAFTIVPARFRCKSCGEEFPMQQDRTWLCPKCQAHGGKVISGREFFLASIEVE